MHKNATITISLLIDTVTGCGDPLIVEDGAPAPVSAREAEEGGPPDRDLARTKLNWNSLNRMQLATN